MSRKQTVDVLNEAYDLELRMSWVLFKQEIAIDYSVDGWVPGEPLFRRPGRNNDECYAMVYNEEQLRWVNRYVGQHIRPMFELFDIEEELSRSSRFGTYNPRYCEDCEVSWDGNDGCWICGVGLYEYKTDALTVYNREYGGIITPNIMRFDVELLRPAYRLSSDYSETIIYAPTRPRPVPMVHQEPYTTPMIDEASSIVRTTVIEEDSDG